MTDPSNPLPSAQQDMPAAADDWKARYDGLNRKYQETVGGLKAELETLKGDNARFANAFKAGEENVAKLTNDLQAAQKAAEEALRVRDEADRVAATTKLALGRASVLARPEFRGLQDYELKGLLRPDVQGDELIKYLTEFSSTLGAVKEQAKRDNLTGVTPPPPAPAGPVSTESLRQQYITAQMSGNTQLADQLYDQLLKAGQPK